MPLLLETIPCLADNYAYLIHDLETGQTALVDAPEAPPILARLAEKGWTLGQIFITHHHPDHIDGVAELVAATG
ncbi:MAG: MBL fold metallo-hydrolase, partial [Cypionkella sp.]